MKKRVLALLLAVMLIVSVLAACGSNTNGSSAPAANNDSSASNSSEPANEPTGEIETIVYAIPLTKTAGIMLSELRKTAETKFFQTVLLPYLLSWVICAYIGYAFLSKETGLINGLLRSMGANPVDWYNDPGKWPFILLFVNIWKGIGYSAIIYMSTIIGIDKSLYESAMVDGASKWEQIRYITLPLLKSTVIMLVIMSIGRMFYSDFGLFYQIPMNSGTLYSTTQTIDTYVYRALMQQNQIGMSAAAGFYQSVVGAILVLAANTVVRKLSPDDAKF